jgi:hypothetical protein
MLPAAIVYRIASILTLSDGAFIVGGQALNIWAERYSSVAELTDFGPYTSKDIDYFGQRDAAAKLAEQIGGRLRIPTMDDATPQSAIVEATIDGHDIEIDFLTHVLGVDDAGLKKAAVNIVLQVCTAEGIGILKVPIMHPFHCLQSRIANVVTLHRKQDIARRQLEASPIVLREYINEMLTAGDHREATDTLERIFEYLRSDVVGRGAHRIMKNDPATLLDYFAEDERIDVRYRENTLANMQRQLANRRTAWGRMKSIIGL